VTGNKIEKEEEGEKEKIGTNKQLMKKM